MVAFSKCENYKDTSISWIQNIPTTWKIERAKWLFRKMERPVRSEDDVVTAFRDGEVTLRKNRREEGFTNAIQEHGYQGIRSGDLVISAMDAFAGAIGVSDSDGKSTPVYSVCIPSGEFYVNNYYYAYLIRYMAKSGFILSLSKGIRERSTDFRFNDFANLYFPIPSKEEQDKIVEFLDRKTAEIDQAIEQKQRLIKLLKEQKAILIDRAVTKGLNPNVPMHDSGIDWIGEIPKHWEIKRLKHFSSTQSGITLGKTYTGKKLIDYPYLRVANIQYGYFNLDDVATLSLPQRETVRYFVKPGDILVTEGGDIDKLGRGTVWECQINNCLHQNHVFAVRLNKSIGLEYFVAIYMACDYGRKYFIDTAIKTTNLASTNRTKLGNLPVILPPLDEQQQIIEYSKTIDNQFDNVISTIMTELNNMNELRQIIIASAVTGNIKI